MAASEPSSFVQTSQIELNPIETEPTSSSSRPAPNESTLSLFIVKSRQKVVHILQSSKVKRWLLYGLIISYSVYFVIAMFLNNPFEDHSSKDLTINLWDRAVFSNNKGLGLLLVTLLVSIMISWDLYLSRRFIQLKLIKSASHFVQENSFWCKLIVKISLCIVCLAYMIFTLSHYQSLVSLAGLVFLLAFSVLISKHPLFIDWNLITNGILVQVLTAIVMLRVEPFSKLLQFFSHLMTRFIELTNIGSELVFGTSYRDHYVAFAVLPCMVFFSAIINVLFYFRVIQYAILKVSWVLKLVLGSSPTESINLVANIFVSQTEAPILIKPFMEEMTHSELFTVMTAGFATLSGPVIASYIRMGIPASHLITSSIMSLTSSFYISKIIYPETTVIKIDRSQLKIMSSSLNQASNFFEAVSLGACSVVKAIGAIVANLIAFSACFSFVDASVAWFFSLINLENFGLISIFQYLFFPLAYLMGVHLDDCKTVSQLIGIKVFVNDLAAYSLLSHSAADVSQLNTTQPIILHERSVAIATHALCGFGNLASIGLQMALMNSFAPLKTEFFARTAFVAMIAGNIANFVNACVISVVLTS